MLLFICVSGNWNEMADNETGILVYTWAVGRSRCGDDVMEYTDPHSHILDQNDWTNVGTAYPLELEGIYELI